ncbi:MAG: exo-alpha-sialidase [Planctomycetales bacterium]|nr:exo-alpha-sialidase [Planctomycetales bacterium]
MVRKSWLLGMMILGCGLVARLTANEAIVTSEFIYTDAPFPQCHASTIEESGHGIVAAWFGGEHEKHPSVGIWVARLENGTWTEPVEVANGNQDGGDVDRYPCWNPVLFQPTEGPLLLFYKVGPNPREWWGELITSNDGGKSWSNPVRLPEGILGPIKNKPIQLTPDLILCGSSSEHAGWRVHFEATPDNGQHWWRTPPVNSGEDFGIIQPAFIRSGNTVMALCRSRQKRIVQVASADGGMTWSGPEATNLPNPNSGFDATTMSDGRHIMIYNHTEKGRSPLNLAVSSDGKTWQAAAVLENEEGEYSYPAIIQTADGLVHMTYTWKRRRVKHVVVDPKKLTLEPIWETTAE